MPTDRSVHGKDVRSYLGAVDLTGHKYESGWNRSVATADRPRGGEDRIGRLIGHGDGKYNLSAYIPRDSAEGLEAKLASLPDDILIAADIYGTSGRGKFGCVRTEGLTIETPGEDKGMLTADLQVSGGVHGAEVLLAPAAHDGTVDGTAYDFGAAGPVGGGGAACLIVYGYELEGGQTTVDGAPAPTVSEFTVDHDIFSVGDAILVDGEEREVTAVDASMRITVSPDLSAAPAANSQVTLVHRARVKIQHRATLQAAWADLLEFDSITEVVDQVLETEDMVERYVRAVVSEFSTRNADDTVSLAVLFERYGD